MIVDHAQVAFHHGQRSAQFVGGNTDEIGFTAIHALQGAQRLAQFFGALLYHLFKLLVEASDFLVQDGILEGHRGLHGEAGCHKHILAAEGAALGASE